jgi:heme A synthase
MNEPTRNDTSGWGTLAAVSAVATYALIVFGGIVRITGSGMGCGDDWPLCNGQLIPPMDFDTLIEYGHRLAALAVSLLVVALATVAWWPRRVAVRRPLRILSLLAVLLLVVQVLLGAVTVWLELPPATVVMHFGTAMALLIVLAVGACVGLAGAERPAVRRDGATRTLKALAAFAFGVALLGALVANLDAGPACLGFPACNGSWMPRGGGLVHVHWTHRLSAYLLFLLLLSEMEARRWRGPHVVCPRSPDWAGPGRCRRGHGAYPLSGHLEGHPPGHWGGRGRRHRRRCLACLEAAGSLLEARQRPFDEATSSTGA